MSRESGNRISAKAEHSFNLDPDLHGADHDDEFAGLAPKRDGSRLGMGGSFENVTRRIRPGFDAGIAAVQLVGEFIGFFLNALGSFVVRGEKRGVESVDQSAVEGNCSLHVAGQVRRCGDSGGK